MTQNERFDNQTVLEICEADKKDLQAEVKHLKLLIKSKNQEIGVLRSKLRSSETQMTELQNFLMSQVSALTAKLTHASTTEPQPTLNNDDISSSVHLDDQDANQEPPPVLTSLPTSSTQPPQDTIPKEAVTPTPQHQHLVPSPPFSQWISVLGLSVPQLLVAMRNRSFLLLRNLSLNVEIVWMIFIS